MAISRGREYEADRIAGRLMGRDVAAAALTEMEVRGAWMQSEFWARHWSKAADNPLPVGPYRSLRRRLARASAHARVSRADSPAESPRAGRANSNASAKPACESTWSERPMPAGTASTTLRASHGLLLLLMSTTCPRPANARRSVLFPLPLGPTIASDAAFRARPRARHAASAAPRAAPPAARPQHRRPSPRGGGRAAASPRRRAGRDGAGARARGRSGGATWGVGGVPDDCGPYSLGATLPPHPLPTIPYPSL